MSIVSGVCLVYALVTPVVSSSGRLSKREAVVSCVMCHLLRYWITAALPVVPQLGVQGSIISKFLPLPFLSNANFVFVVSVLISHLPSTLPERDRPLAAILENSGFAGGIACLELGT